MNELMFWAILLGIGNIDIEKHRGHEEALLGCILVLASIGVIALLLSCGGLVWWACYHVYIQ